MGEMGGEINNLCGDNKTAISGRNERQKTGGEQRRKIEKNRKFGNQKVSKVVGEKKKVAWQMLQHRLTHARRFHDNNNLVSLSCRNSTFQEGAHRGSSALFGTEMPPERRLDLCVCLGTPHEHNNGGTLLQNKPLEMYLLSIIYVPPLGLKGGSESCDTLPHELQSAPIHTSCDGFQWCRRDETNQTVRKRPQRTETSPSTSEANF